MLLAKNLILTACFCFTFLILIGQPNFKEGFVITNNGDTMRGQIDYRDWYVNPQKIDFRNEKGRKFVFDTNSIRYFEVKKTKNEIEQFLSASLNIDETPTSYIIEDSTNNPKLKHVSYFLRYIVRGELNLFQLVDDREKLHLIVQKGNDELEALFYKKYYQIKDEKDFSPKHVKNLVEVHRYRVQLRKLTIDCSSITDERIEKLRFEQKMIRQFVIQYNTCAHPEKLVYIESISKWRFKFWAGGGVGYSRIFPVTSIGRMSYINSTDFPERLYPALSVGMQATIPKTSEKLHLCVELSNKIYQYNSTIESPITSGTVTTVTDIDFSYIHPNFLIRFIPYSKNLTVGFDFGVVGNAVGTFQAEINEVYPSFARDYIYEPLLEEGGASRSFVGGGFIGYKNKFNLHFRYENFYMEYPQITFEMKTFYTYLTYTF